ncbi:pyridoxamine 5'-phosphate oxidase family protein [Ilumatobacter sp.]|uniref:pyridoxamine 5'-phosphate oxidase family protein n=1 Tax=Ilumatobacter sp. TaxID=1967498 RepID=UPI003C350A8C
MDLVGMMGGGVAVVVATASDDGRPALTRGWGPSYDDEAGVLTLAITAPAGSSTLTNLESNGAIAATVSEPLTYRTAQLKGTVEHVGAPSEADRIAVHEHLGRFIAEVAMIGIEQDADRLFSGDLRMVSFTVDEFYDQTPGDHAGERLR